MLPPCHLRSHSSTGLGSMQPQLHLHPGCFLTCAGSSTIKAAWPRASRLVCQAVPRRRAEDLVILGLQALALGCWPRRAIHPTAVRLHVSLLRGA
jgi:hypothetical protein